MDASYKIQRGIHVHLIQFFMCPEFWVHIKARVFAIRSCKSNEPKGFKFSKPRGEQKGVVTISNKNLLDPLRAVTGEDWIPGKRYRVRGFWVADAKTMCFDLNEGVQEDFRPVTPSNDAE